MNSHSSRLLLFLVALWFTGCASKKASVIARLDPQYSPAATQQIALAHPHQARPEEQELARALTAELERRGFQIVPQEAADYTLAYWIEDDWRTRKTIVKTIEPGLELRGGVPTRMPVSPGSPGWQPQRSDPALYQAARVVDEQVPAQGIRLRLYSRESIRAGRLQTAWDGYIDGGQKVSPKRQPILLKTLLDYFGKDFTGSTVLLPPETE